MFHTCGFSWIGGFFAPSISSNFLHSRSCSTRRFCWGYDQKVGLHNLWVWRSQQGGETSTIELADGSISKLCRRRSGSHHFTKIRGFTADRTYALKKRCVSTMVCWKQSSLMPLCALQVFSIFPIMWLLTKKAAAAPKECLHDAIPQMKLKHWGGSACRETALKRMRGFSRGDVGVTLRLRWRVEAHLVALQTRNVTILSDNKIIHRSSWVTNTFNGQMIHLKFTEPCKNLYPGSLVRQHLPGSMKHDQLLHWRIT